jgi:hypothetical protein
MNDFPKIAPHESCVACLKDTSTAIQVLGVPEWCMAQLAHWADIEPELAIATFNARAEEQGFAPGTVPDGPLQWDFRLCRDCAARTGAKVFELDDLGPGYA